MAKTLISLYTYLVQTFPYCCREPQLNGLVVLFSLLLSSVEVWPPLEFIFE